MFGGERKKENSFKDLIPGKKKSAAESMSDSARNMVPTFQDEPACAKCCPKLSFKQVLTHLILALLFFLFCVYSVLVGFVCVLVLDISYL